MWFRLKNHLIWTPEDFPFIRRRLQEKPETVLIRPSGFKIFAAGSWTRGEIGAVLILYKNRPLHCQNSENRETPFFSPSLSLSKHYSSSSSPFQPIFPPLYSSPSSFEPGFGILAPWSSRKDGLIEASSRLIFRSSSKSNSKPPPLLFIYTR